MVVLAIDFGDRRIGLAKSDPMGILASGLDTLIWKDDISVPVSHILELTKQYKVEKIVLGMPRNMDGTYGARAKATEQFAEALKKLVDIEIIYWDERLTTASAMITLRDQGKKGSRDKGAVDRAAACHILQSYLDSK
jgi:putative Holliday junction resolvase